MGSVDDVRKVMQDLVVPDMKAIQARIESLEKEMNLRFTHLKTEMDLRFSASERLAAQRQDTVLNTMAAYYTTVTNALEMEKRLARLKSERKTEGRSHEQ